MYHLLVQDLRCDKMDLVCVLISMVKKVSLSYCFIERKFLVCHDPLLTGISMGYLQHEDHYCLEAKLVIAVDILTCKFKVSDSLLLNEKIIQSFHDI